MLPLLQIYFDRLRASEIDTGSIARALADAVREADKSAAAGVYLRDYAGETLFLAGCSPGNGAAESDAPSLSADNWDDPLCYCIHTGAPAHFQRICELPASARLLAFPTPESVRSYGIFPIPAAGGGVAGAVIALHDEASPAHRRICHYLCQFAGLLFSLAGEKKCSRHALRSMEEDVRQLNERRAAADPLHPDGPKRPALVGDSRATSALRQAVDRQPVRTLPCFSQVRPAPEKACWPAWRTRQANAETVLFWKSTAPPFPRICLRANCSATSAAHSAAPWQVTRACCAAPRAEPCSWTK